MTWVITNYQFMNNVLSETLDKTSAVCGVYSYDARALASMGPIMDGNVYADSTLPPDTLLVAARDANGSYYYQTLAEWQSVYNIDNASSFYNAPVTDADDAVLPNYAGVHTKAIPLPADIATLIGRGAGEKHAGCWR